MPGVPASLTSETIEPAFNKAIILFKFLLSLNLWLDINFELILCLLNKFFEILVSSQSIKSDLFNISIDLKVISPKFPIGVETRYNPLLIFCFEIYSYVW